MSIQSERLRAVAHDLLRIADEIDGLVPCVDYRFLSRAGATMRAVIMLFPVDGSEITVKNLLSAGPRKQVYNTIGYLTRKGKIVRVSYGRYRLNMAPVCVAAWEAEK
jgi:hypothetical protein